MAFGFGLSFPRWSGSIIPYIYSLFAAGEVGTWYDPSDLTTLFQDSAGTTPVTAAGQPVGLMLDKSKGLAIGSEILPNGDFSQGSTGWSVGTGWSVSGGVATHAGELGVLLSTPATAFTIGLSYIIEFDYSGNTGPFAIYLRGANVINGNINTASGHFKGIGVAGTSTSEGLSILATANLTIDNVSVKLLAGNHAKQATSAQRPTYGIHPYSGVRNRFLYSEQFDNAYWTKSNGAITPDAAVAPNGTTTADRLSWVSTVNSQVQAPATTIPAGSTITLSTYAKAGTKSSLTLVMFTDGSNYVVVSFNLTSGTAGTPLVLGTRYTSVETTATSVGDGWYRCSVKTVTNTLTTVESWLRGDTLIGSGDNILLWGAQLEAGSSASAYQAVTTQYNITEAGVPSVHYVGFDGVDDGMVTSAIDFSATDAVTVFTGLRKLSDAARAMVVELGSPSATGSFQLSAPASAASNYAYASTGNVASIFATSPSSYPFPDTAVLTGQSKISTDTVTLRRNGIEVGASSADQGTVNYSNAILYIGRRGGTSLPFNGNIYSLIIRGAQSTTGQITATETWVNGKTGAF